MTPGVLPFLGIAALLTITPGADMAIVTRTALQQGRRAAAWASVGICTGLLVWAAASALGVAAVLTASSTAYRALQLLGAAYLVVLGVQSLLSARRTRPAAEVDGNDLGAGTTARTAFRRGLVNNLLNPKIAVFYTTFLPQFVAPGQPVLATSLLLATIHLAMGLVWLTAYAWALTSLRGVMQSDRVRRTLEGLSGTVLVGFGLRLALLDRR